MVSRPCRKRRPSSLDDGGILGIERTGGEEPSEVEKNEDEDSLKVERMGGEEPLQTEKTRRVEEEQRESEEEKECQAEDVSEAGAPQKPRRRQGQKMKDSSPRRSRKAPQKQKQ